MTSAGHIPQFFTIGVYGTTEGAFFDALQAAGVDMFCDIRRRRGVRGPEYAFVNSNRLQSALAERSIGYVHLLSLAPTNEVREGQYEVDRQTGTGKRDRSVLSPEFAEAYRDACLADFDAAAFVEQFGEAKRVVLFCVEREAAACHRSLLAERLQRDLSISVVHLVP